MAMLVMVKAPVPELLSVMFCALLAIPTSVLGNERLVGDSAAAGTTIPVPDRATV